METILKSGQCPLINHQSKGLLSYEIVKTDKRTVSIRLSANSSGGFFSTDLVSNNDIQAVLTPLVKTNHFSSTVFNGLFKGKSANNPSFLAAVLRAENVITCSKHHTYKHTYGTVHQ